MTTQLTTRAQTVTQFLRRPEQWDGPYDIVFADPPYAAAYELEPLFLEVDAARLFAADARLVIEHAKKTTLGTQLAGCSFLRRYQYGDTVLSVFSRPDRAPS